jgi:hypothetical protein
MALGVFQLEGSMHAHIRTTAVALIFGALGGCTHAVQMQSGGEVATTNVIPADAHTLPAGATFDVQLDQTISASQSHVGDQFTAHVVNSLMAQNGQTTIPAGAVVQGHVTGLQPSSDPTKPGLVRVDFDALSFNGRTYPFNAAVQTTSMPVQGSNGIYKSAGTGAAVGGLLGAVLGKGDLKDIIVGGAIGAAAGTLISLGTDVTQARLPAGSRLTIVNSNTISLS